MLKLANIVALAGGALVVAFASPAGGQQITFRLGHVDAQASHSGVGADAFVAAVARLSKDTMKVRVFHARASSAQIRSRCAMCWPEPGTCI